MIQCSEERIRVCRLEDGWWAMCPFYEDTVFAKGGEINLGGAATSPNGAGERREASWRCLCWGP
jgi:hypothetical protein